MERLPGVAVDARASSLRVGIKPARAIATDVHTQVFGFMKKTEIPLGEARWLTAVSPDSPNGTELLLEPDDHPAVKPFKEALVSDGIPFTSFAVDDVDKEFKRLRELGVQFTQEPAEMGPVTTAVFDDTCGNLDSDRSSEVGRAWRPHRRRAHADRDASMTL